MKHNKVDTIIFITFITFITTSCFALGWYSNDWYRFYDTERQINGLWMKNFPNKSNALETAYSLESRGTWVCVNVRPERTFDEIVQTCVHEAGHELFARKCDQNPEICFEVMKELEK
jgi:hypothetical protein